MNQQLISQLQGWDGKHTEYLIDIYKANLLNPDFLDDLISIFRDDINLDVAATWLLKHHLEHKNIFFEKQIEAIFQYTNNAKHWGAQLHLLQILPMVRLNYKVLEQVEEFIKNCLKSPKKLVRAWAYNGLYELYNYKPELKKEVIFLCKRAIEVETGAVKVRLRKVLDRLDD